MTPHINGLHHVTATVNDAQEDLDFYTRLLGLRLVKKTVNFDNPSVYHFYYGNAAGTPGTIMTTFPYKDKGVRVGAKGVGQITMTSFSVPAASLAFWENRLVHQGVPVRKVKPRFGEETLTFDDPSGLVLALIATDQDDRPPWPTDEVEAACAIRGIHSVILTIPSLAPTRRLLEDVLGFGVLGEADNRMRFGVGSGSPGTVLDVLHLPDAPRAVNGLGTVHHVALAVGTDDEQYALRDALLGLGYHVTEVKDRQYFRSIYFREPGGVLLEIATEGPGFMIDEDARALGRSLKLPPWEEPHRTAIEAALADVTH